MSNPNDAVKHIIATIFAAQKALQDLVPEGRWRGMGNLLGDYGEFIALNYYGLTRAPSRSNGYDALTADGKKVQVKTNYSSSTIGIRGDADLLLVLKVQSNGEWTQVYFGPLAPIMKVSRYSKRDNKYMISMRHFASLEDKADK